MRPVNKGVAEDDQGVAFAFAEYAEAYPYLRDRLGLYCSYCELPIRNNPEIEHKIPKNNKTGDPSLECCWGNLLLACKHCNTNKGSKAVNKDDYFWPDEDNTFRAFEYREAARIVPHPELDAAEAAKADATIKLFGLERIEDDLDKPPAERDNRWRDRKHAWGKAGLAKEDLEKEDHAGMKKWMLLDVVDSGFFSVWMTVFKEDADMKSRLIEAFPGTRGSRCFDGEGNVVPRAGGKL